MKLILDEKKEVLFLCFQPLRLKSKKCSRFNSPFNFLLVIMTWLKLVWKICLICSYFKSFMSESDVSWIIMNRRLFQEKTRDTLSIILDNVLEIRFTFINWHINRNFNKPILTQWIISQAIKCNFSLLWIKMIYKLKLNINSRFGVGR